jgi:hypothetical protein
MKFCFLGEDCFRKGELATIFMDASYNFVDSNSQVR